MTTYIHPNDLIGYITERSDRDPSEILENADRNRLSKDLSSRKVPLPDFTCVYDAMNSHDYSTMTEQDKEDLLAIQEQMLDDSSTGKQFVGKLQTLKEKYPDISVIYNFLSIAYQISNQSDAHQKTLEETIQRFPDYLFGKCSLAGHYLRSDQIEKIPTVFQHKMQLPQHYPKGTKEYHLSEIRAFYHLTGSYYALTDDITMAMYAWSILREVDPGHFATRELALRILKAEARAFTGTMRRNNWRMPASSDEEIKDELMEDLRAAMPFFVSPKKGLIHSLKQDGTKLKPSSRLQATDIIDLGNEGGIGLAIRRPQNALVVSLTHVKFDRKHPLYKQVFEYQRLRTERLQAEHAEQGRIGKPESFTFTPRS